MDPKSPPRPTQQQIEKKLQIASALFRLVFELKKEQIKKKFPLLSDQELNNRTYALIEKGCR